MIGICVIHIILGKRNNRTRAVQGTKNQYNITPTQTLFSPNFFIPKLRRLVVVLALALIVQTRTLESHEHRILILAIHTSLLTQQCRRYGSWWNWCPSSAHFGGSQRWWCSVDPRVDLRRCCSRQGFSVRSLVCWWTSHSYILIASYILVRNLVCWRTSHS